MPDRVPCVSCVRAYLGAWGVGVCALGWQLQCLGTCAAARLSGDAAVWRRGCMRACVPSTVLSLQGQSCTAAHVSWRASDTCNVRCGVAALSRTRRRRAQSPALKLARKMKKAKRAGYRRFSAGHEFVFVPILSVIRYLGLPFEASSAHSGPDCGRAWVRGWVRGYMGAWVHGCMGAWVRHVCVPRHERS